MLQVSGVAELTRIQGIGGRFQGAAAQELCPWHAAVSAALTVQLCVCACSTLLDGRTTLEQLSDVCGLFVMQDEGQLLAAEAKAHDQPFNPDDNPHLIVLTVVGWLQKLINRAFIKSQAKDAASVRALAASSILAYEYKAVSRPACH